MKTTRDNVFIYGKHSLMEALANAPKIIKKVFLSPEIKDQVLRDLLEANNIPVGELGRGNEKEMVGRGTVHQGIIARVNTSTLLQDFDSFMEGLDMGKKPGVVILGEVQDPHNVGAIIRSAAAFGLAGVLIPEHNQAQITGAVVKTSVGMVFRIPLVSIGNVNHTLKVLKEKGFWTYALEMEGSTPLPQEQFDVPAAFVVGNEGAGIREKTLSACDITLSIPLHPRTESLNASVSAAVAFYEWSKKHPEAL